MEQDKVPIGFGMALAMNEPAGQSPQCPVRGGNAADHRRRYHTVASRQGGFSPCRFCMFPPGEKMEGYFAGFALYFPRGSRYNGAIG